jgi:hypothetical protein
MESVSIYPALLREGRTAIHKLSLSLSFTGRTFFEYITQLLLTRRVLGFHCVCNLDWQPISSLIVKVATVTPIPTCIAEKFECTTMSSDTITE